MYTLIIPVYNAAAKINRMLRSLEQQTDQNFECIFINDGSTDASLDILTEFCDKYNNATIYTQQHAGLVAALKNGATHSTTDYIGFLDADDIAEPILVEYVNRAIETYHPDGIIYDYRREHIPYINNYTSPTNMLYYENADLQYVKQAFMHGHEAATRWTKVVSKRLWNEIVQWYDNKMSYSEDTYFAGAFYHYIQNLVRITQPLMTYMLSFTGMSNSYRSQKQESVALIVKTLREKLHEVFYAQLVERRD